MTRVIEGELDGMNLGVGIVVARFNEFVTRRLLDGALRALESRGVPSSRITVVWVPGAFEVASAGAALLARDDVDTAIALGAVIRGETAHFDFVCRAATDGVLRAGLDAGKPYTFGVITVDTVEQAFARSGDGFDNVGATSALTAIEMANLHRTIGSDRR